MKSVKELREITGLSQSKFADLYSINVRTLQSWECGAKNIPEYAHKLLERVVLEDFKDNI